MASPALKMQTEANSSSSHEGYKEFSFPALFLGAILAIVMGAANAYLGLKAGMTVAASIPAAVIAMAILHGVMRRNSILESNLVQTSASAGETVAAGIIFTMPAMILVGVWGTFDYWTTTLIAMTGGLLGILFMIPMRRVFVVEDKELPYPEGVACAEVLRAGEGEAGEGEEAEVQEGAKLLFTSLGLGAVYKFVGTFIGMFAGGVEIAKYAGSRVFAFGFDLSPALMGVGYIVGANIATLVFLGAAIGWIVAMPLFTADPTAGSAIDQAWTIWSTKIRYIGVGAMVVAGVDAIWRVRGSLLSAVKDLLLQFKTKTTGDIAKTDRNLSGKSITVLAIGTVALTFGIYYSLLSRNIQITALVTVIMVVMAFFFTAVSTYIVGLVGSSNTPVSGMTICTVLVTGGLLYLLGFSGTHAMVATLGVAGIVCVVAAVSGDTSNDLKTGYIIGATPRNQQLMQILGVVMSALVIAPVLIALHQGSINEGTGGIGGKELPAPQAGLFAALAQGFFGDGQLPWNMIIVGVLIGMGLLFAKMVFERANSRFKIHIMPCAIGIYLPIGLMTPIFVGGLIRWFAEKVAGSRAESAGKRGTLLASGIIAGESIIGVVLGIMAFIQIKRLGLGGEMLGAGGVEVLSLIAFAAFLVWFYRKTLATKTS